jgi:hypothetical protein
MVYFFLNKTMVKPMIKKLMVTKVHVVYKLLFVRACILLLV